MPDKSGNNLLLAVGLFDTQPRLESTLADLHDEGFSARDMCVLGTPAAFSQIVKPPARPLVPRSTKPLHQRQLHPLPWLLSDLDVRATSGILLQTLNAHAAVERGGLVAPTSRIVEELGTKLAPHLRRHEIALVVNAGDHLRQTQGARVLLRHTLHPIHIYDVRVGGGAD